MTTILFILMFLFYLPSMIRPRKRRRTRIDKSWFGTGYFFGRNVNRHIL